MGMGANQHTPGMAVHARNSSTQEKTEAEKGPLEVHLDQLLKAGNVEGVFRHGSC